MAYGPISRWANGGDRSSSFYKGDLISLLKRMMCSAHRAWETLAPRVFRQKPRTQLFFFRKTLSSALKSLPPCFSTKAWYTVFLLSKDLIIGSEILQAASRSSIDNACDKIPTRRSNFSAVIGPRGLAHMRGGGAKRSAPCQQVGWPVIGNSAGGRGKHFKDCRHRRSVQSGYLLGQTARFVEACQVGLHRLIFSEHSQRFPQNFCSACIHGYHDLVVHPLPLTPCGDHFGTSQIGQVARNLRLTLAENLDKITNAHLPAIHQVQQPEPSAIGQRSEQESQIVSLWGAVHISMIYALTDMSSR